MANIGLKHHRDVRDAISDTNISSEFLQALTPAKFDWRSLEHYAKTPLQTLLDCVSINSSLDEPRLNEVLKKAKWMMSQGADPFQHKEDKEAKEDEDEDEVAPAAKIGDTEHDRICICYEDEDGDGLSAMVSALRLLSELIELKEAYEDEGMQVPSEVKWPLQAVTKLTNLFKTLVPSEASRVPVNEEVVERWADFLQDQESHDTTFETADGTCTAHAFVLKAASPVLKASLSSEMLEGKEKRLVIKDCPLVAVKLLLELIYVGGCPTDIDVEAALAAFDLAHRWQIQDVLRMIQKVLNDMLTIETFDAIATASERLQVYGLIQACKAFGNQNASIQERAKSRKLPKPLLAWFPDMTSRSPKAKKRRML